LSREGIMPVTASSGNGNSLLELWATCFRQPMVPEAARFVHQENCRKPLLNTGRPVLEFRTLSYVPPDLAITWKRIYENQPKAVAGRRR